jgi:hypothetical protein
MMLAVGALVHGQPDPLETQRQSIVRLRVNRTNLPSETAAGMIIGWTDTRVYVITACHALLPDCGAPEAPVTGVELQGYRRAESFPAVVFGRFDPALDLAVVSAAVPRDFPLRPALIRSDPEPGANIHVIGHPAAGEWSVWRGSVLNENGPSGDVTHFVYAGTSLPTDGFSGGAIFNAAGRVLGLHSRTSGAAAYGLGMKMDDVVRQLQVWQVPANAFTRPIVKEITMTSQAPRTGSTINVPGDPYVAGRIAPDSRLMTFGFTVTSDRAVPWAQLNVYLLSGGDYCGQNMNYAPSWGPLAAGQTETVTVSGFQVFRLPCDVTGVRAMLHTRNNGLLTPPTAAETVVETAFPVTYRLVRAAQ